MRVDLRVTLACLGAFWATSLVACGDDAEPSPGGPVPSSSSVGSGNVGQGGGGGVGGDPTSSGQGGALPTPPVYLGIATAPLGAGAIPPAEAQLAELTTLAAGVRAVRIDVPWDAFDAETLEDRVARHADEERQVMVSLAVVDRLRALRPEATGALAWDDPAVVAALQADVAAIAALAEGEVDVIALGADVDAYLAAQPGEAAALASLLTSGLTVVPSTTLAGVGLSSSALDGPIASAVQPLVDASTALVVSYRPGEAGASAAAATPAKDLDAMTEVAGERPVVLSAVAFASSGEGRSEESQRQSLDGFFAALRPRRAAFPYLVVEQLHDLAPERCASLAAGQGEDPEGPWATHRCHLGLRTAEGEPKAVWIRMLQATAELALP